jgi:simple sugar transport system permease protein
MADIIFSTLAIVSPVLIAAVGGLICERSGVKNIALEGLMSVGAMAGATALVLLETEIGFSVPLALFFAAFCGGLFSSIHAFASVTLKANQLVSGTGINLLSAGITVFVCQIIFRMDRTPHFGIGNSAASTGIILVAGIALVVLAASWFVLRLGNGIRHQYIAVIVSGLLAGLAGALVVLTQDTQFTANTISGKGFIALAAITLGRRLPLGILGVSFLFGLFISLAKNIFNIRIIDTLPSDVLNMLPYIIILFSLVVFHHEPRKQITPEYLTQGHGDHEVHREE